MRQLLSWRARAALVVALVLSILAGAGPSRAEQPKGKEAARIHYQRATQHYNLSEFAEALAAFRDAYRAFPEPTLLFNIAQCQRQLGDKSAAVLTYKAFLREMPNTPNRTEVSGLIITLERQLQDEQSTRARPPGGVLPPPGSVGAPGPTVASTAPPQQPRVEEPKGAEPKPVEVKAAEPSQLDARTAAAPTKDGERRSTPLYKKWWLWTTVGVVVAAGVGIGLGVGLSQPTVRYPQATTTDGSFNF